MTWWARHEDPPGICIMIQRIRLLLGLFGLSACLLSASPSAAQSILPRPARSKAQSSKPAASVTRQRPVDAKTLSLRLQAEARAKKQRSTGNPPPATQSLLPAPRRSSSILPPSTSQRPAKRIDEANELFGRDTTRFDPRSRPNVVNVPLSARTLKSD